MPSRPVRVTVEYLDGDGEDVRMQVSLVGVPRRNDHVSISRSGVRIRVLDVEWRTASDNDPPEVVVYGELRRPPESATQIYRRRDFLSRRK